MWSETGQYKSEVLGVASNDSATTTHKAVAIEQVSVPAGKFECLHTDNQVSVQSDDGSPPTLFHVQAWYGRQVGVVKATATVGDGGTAEMVLTSYKVP